VHLPLVGSTPTLSAVTASVHGVPQAARTLATQRLGKAITKADDRCQWRQGFAAAHPARHENSRLRDECLHVNPFASIEDAGQKIEAWRQDDNHHRPDRSLGHLAPNEFAMQGRETAAETAKLQIRRVEKPGRPQSLQDRRFKLE